jgi:prevent-host-death family protein
MEQTISATEAKTHFGEALGKALQEPLYIERNGKPLVVMLSLKNYEKLKEIEDCLWNLRAQEAAKEGFKRS